jgi:hypothetical protein
MYFNYTDYKYHLSHYLYYAHNRSVPVYFIWLKYLSWFMYGNEALLVNQWEGITTIDCNRSNATCPASGAVVLETLDFKPVWNFAFFRITVCVPVIT